MNELKQSGAIQALREGSRSEASDRDFVGYGGDAAACRLAGRRPPRAQLRDQLRGGLGILDRRRRRPLGGALTEVSAPRVPAGDRDLAAESMYEYGSRAGSGASRASSRSAVLPATVFGCALALERNPPAASFVRDQRLGRLLPRLALDRALPPDRGRKSGEHIAKRRRLV